MYSLHLSADTMWASCGGHPGSSPVLSVSVPAVWSVVVSVTVVFAIAEGGVRSFSGLCCLPEGIQAVLLFTAAFISTRWLMPVRAVAVPAALVLLRAVLQPFNI